MREDAKQRRTHVDKAGKLSVVRQCELLDILDLQQKSGQLDKGHAATF